LTGLRPCNVRGNRSLEADLRAMMISNLFREFRYTKHVSWLATIDSVMPPGSAMVPSQDCLEIRA
jgi:hypothetical protein